jgi:hypothetical protein
VRAAELEAINDDGYVAGTEQAGQQPGSPLSSGRAAHWLTCSVRFPATGRGGPPAIPLASFITYTQRVGQETWDYTLKQAAAVCSVNFGTIKRRLRAGDPPHARCLDDATSAWVVSLGDPAGLRLDHLSAKVVAGTSVRCRGPRHGVLAWRSGLPLRKLCGPHLPSTRLRSVSWRHSPSPLCPTPHPMRPSRRLHKWSTVMVEAAAYRRLQRMGEHAWTQPLQRRG